jgi:hypothetical protein
MKLFMLGMAASVLAVTTLAGQAATLPKDQRAPGQPKSADPRQLEGPIIYTATMKGSSETPPNSGNASGHVKLTFGKNHIRYEIDVSDLSGPATAAHIHIGAIGKSGPPVYTFTIKHDKTGKIADGTIDLANMPSPGISGDSLRTLLDNGHAYVNVHTAAHPGGEIRGQIVKE